MPNLAFLAADDQVGGQHDLGAAGQGVTLDGGDHGLAWRAFGEPDAATGDGGNLTGHEGLEVHARTEGSACAGHDRHREVSGVVEFVHRVGQTLRDGEVERVARLRPIDGDDQNPAAALGENLVATALSPQFGCRRIRGKSLL